MIWRVITHIRMRWHEVAADRATRSAGALINAANRHIETANRLAKLLRVDHEN